MNNKRIWQEHNSHEKKSVVSLEDEAANLVFENLAKELYLENIQIASFEILRKLLLFKKIDYEKYYRKIEDLIIRANSEKQIDKGVNRIVKEIIEELETK